MALAAISPEIIAISLNAVIDILDCGRKPQVYETARFGRPGVGWQNSGSVAKGRPPPDLTV